MIYYRGSDGDTVILNFDEYGFVIRSSDTEKYKIREDFLYRIQTPETIWYRG